MGVHEIFQHLEICLSLVGRSKQFRFQKPIQTHECWILPQILLDELVSGGGAFALHGRVKNGVEHIQRGVMLLQRA